MVISHVIVSIFTILGTLLERTLIARPDLPESTFWYNDILFGASYMILFILPFLLFINLGWYRIIGLISYLLISLFWFSMINYNFNSLLLNIKLGDLKAFFDLTHIFYFICIALYIFPIIIFTRLYIHQSNS